MVAVLFSCNSPFETFIFLNELKDFKKYYLPKDWNRVMAKDDIFLRFFNEYKIFIYNVKVLLHLMYLLHCSFSYKTFASSLS